MKAPRRASEDDDRLIKAASRLGSLWSFPALAESVSMRFSSRLSRSWARTNLRANTITLACELADDHERLENVLCHELAHVVAFLRVGRAEGPHGPTWQRLVRDAGYEPVLRLPDRATAHASSKSASRQFLHRCPICDFSRTARRPTTTWRCADCVAAGLGGELIIAERPGPT